VHRSDLLAVTVLVLAAGAFLSPAVVDGTSFGGFDLDTSLTGLGAGLYPVIHNHGNGDAVSQMISWNALDWRMIHAGHFPLWNDYSGLGMPEFLNFESSVLSLPDLVSYLVPLRDAFLVVVFMKFVIAGTGAYLCARVLALRVPAAMFAGVTFMFSGAFANWVTWPLSDVVAWAGWIAAFVILAYRTRRGFALLGLALSVAFSVFGGFPEANITMLLVLGAFFAAGGIASLVVGRPISVAGLGRVALGTIAGAALSAPLWLPGLQVLSGSHRETEGLYKGLPLKTLPLLFTQGYFGEPFGGPTTFGLTRWNYYETVAYVGVPALAFGLVALFGRRRVLVVGLAVAVLVGFAATYEPVSFHPFFSIVNRIGGLSQVRFERTRAMTSFAIAMLAAVGFDECWTLVRGRERVRRAWLAFGVTGVVVVAVAIKTVSSTVADPRLAPHRRALVAPLVLVALLVLVGIAIAIARRRSPGSSRTVCWVGMGAILAAQGAFLLVAGVGIPSYSHAFYPATPAVRSLQSLVGTNLVGLDAGNTTSVKSFGHVGFYPEVNIGYRIRLFAIHDPLVPSAYFTSWPVHAAAPARGGVGLFVPNVDSAPLARMYGISYILAGPHLAPPSGTVKVAVLADETLYRVPGAARFGFDEPSVDRVVSVHGSTATGFTIQTTGTVRGKLLMRVTAVPGWHVAVDGRPERLAASGVMESVWLSPGSHRVTLEYRPDRFVVGLAVAAGTALAAGTAAAAVLFRRRKRTSTPIGAEGG
jgi:hypothetical protein